MAKKSLEDEVEGEKIKEKADEHDSWNTNKLLDEFHKYTDYKKQSTMRGAQKRAMSTQNQIETEFFKDLYGESETEPEQPKHKKIKTVTKEGEELTEEDVARRLIHRHALRSIAKEKGVSAAKQYADSPDQIKEYVDGKLGQGAYDTLVKQLSDSGQEVDEIEQYNTFKTRMAQARVKDFETFDHIRRHLQNKKHYDNLLKHHEERTGVKIKSGEEPASILESLTAYGIGGGKKDKDRAFTPQHMEQHYKKYKLTKEQKEEYSIE